MANELPMKDLVFASGQSGPRRKECTPEFVLMPNERSRRGATLLEWRVEFSRVAVLSPQTVHTVGSHCFTLEQCHP